MKNPVQFSPVEAFVVDSFTKQKLVVEYRGESHRSKPGKRLYKVYSPFFDNSKIRTKDSQLESYRWTEKFEILGPAPTLDLVGQHLEIRI
jgi:hypothetical protein